MLQLIVPEAVSQNIARQQPQIIEHVVESRRNGAKGPVFGPWQRRDEGSHRRHPLRLQHPYQPVEKQAAPADASQWASAKA